MSDHATFLKNFLRHPTRVGAIAPSSPALVETMVQWFDWESARNVVEFGPGTGVFTAAIADHLHPEAKFFAIERNPEMAAKTRQRCPGVTVHQENATELVELCRRESMPSVDAIVCGLPWASFPASLQEEIIGSMLATMTPGAQFATFAYWQGMLLPAARGFTRLLEKRFTSVERSPTVWRNVPPAFVYRCVR